jgi:hypothetical protein
MLTNDDLDEVIDLLRNKVVPGVGDIRADKGDFVIPVPAKRGGEEN